MARANANQLQSAGSTIASSLLISAAATAAAAGQRGPLRSTLRRVSQIASRHQTVVWLSTRPTTQAIEPTWLAIIAHSKPAPNAWPSGRNRRQISATSNELAACARQLLTWPSGGQTPPSAWSIQKLRVISGR